MPSTPPTARPIEASTLKPWSLTVHILDQRYWFLLLLRPLWGRTPYVRFRWSQRVLASTSVSVFCSCMAVPPFCAGHQPGGLWKTPKVATAFSYFHTFWLYLRSNALLGST